MPYSTSTWVDNEFNSINLGDERLNQRFKVIAAQLARHCGKTLASSFCEWKMIKAGYQAHSWQNLRSELRNQLEIVIFHSDLSDLALTFGIKACQIKVHFKLTSDRSPNSVRIESFWQITDSLAIESRPYHDTLGS